MLVGYFGDRGALASTIRACESGGVAVVVVAFDLGGRTLLAALRDDVLALGALRCHALDVREQFAREVIVPALSDAAGEPSARLEELARPFVHRMLESIRELEGAIPVDSGEVVVPWTTPPAWSAGPGNATIELRFVDAVPAELNGIPMTLAEILESLETISGQPAVDVLRLAYENLRSATDACVELALVDGRVEVLARLVAS
jgi:argininosuccinate synthase